MNLANEIETAQSLIYISESNTQTVEQETSKLENFIKEKIALISTTLNKMTDVEKDDLFKLAQQSMNDYNTFLTKVQFISNFTKEEFNWIYDLVSKDAEYDTKDIFLARKLQEDLLDKYSGKNGRLLDESAPVVVDINSITILFSIMEKIKVTGLISKNSIIYQNLLLKVGAINKIYNNFHMKSQEIAKSISINIMGKLDQDTFEKNIDNIAAGGEIDVDSLDESKVPVVELETVGV